MSQGVDENDLMCVDPLAAAEALKTAINRLTDGEVAAAAHHFGLNIRFDAMILRNRVKRYEMRRHFGDDGAPWDPAQDKPGEESHSTSSPALSSRHSVANFQPNRVPEQAAGASSDADRGPLSTGQSMGRFCEPMSMELPSQTFRSQVRIELSDLRMVADEARADSQIASAARCSETQRHVSIVAPAAVYALSSQSTSAAQEQFVRENSMDLTSTVSGGEGRAEFHQ